VEKKKKKPNQLGYSPTELGHTRRRIVEGQSVKRVKSSRRSKPTGVVADPLRVCYFITGLDLRGAGKTVRGVGTGVLRKKIPLTEKIYKTREEEKILGEWTASKKWGGGSALQAGTKNVRKWTKKQ